MGYIYPAWLTVNAADALTTWMGLGLGMAELNPVFLGLITTAGIVPALFLKLVDPLETEGEHFEVYEQILASL